MKIWDISVGITPGMTCWPGHPEIKVDAYRSLCRGDSSNSSSVAFSVHTGTHVDAPSHFLESGGGVDRLSLETLIGPAQLIEFPESVTEVSASNLNRAGVRPGVERILLKTRNSALWADPRHEFYKSYVSLTTDGAQWLVDHRVKLIGIDYLSIQKFRDTSSRTHHVLLDAGVVIVEGLDLREPRPGMYHLSCLPLKIIGCDGAPARAVLSEIGSE
jgi:arylformamidase